MSKLILFNATWFKVKDFILFDNDDYDVTVLKNEDIYISPKSKLTEYNPFYYYNNPISEDIVNDILGNTLNIQQTFFIHNLFLSLEPTNINQYIKWIEYFGVISYLPDMDNLFTSSQYKSTDTIPTCVSKNDLEYIGCMREFTQELSTLQFFVNAVKIIKNDYQSIETFMSDFLLETSLISDLQYEGFCTLLKEKIPALPNIYFSAEDSIINKLKSEYDDTDLEPPSLAYQAHYSLINKTVRTCRLIPFIKKAFEHLGNRFLDVFVEFVFSEKLIEISPKIKIVNGKFSFNLAHETLIGLIYFFFALDFAGNIIPRKCLAKGCTRNFMPTREDAIYCSETCKKRAKQQRHREKVKKQQSNA